MLDWKAINADACCIAGIYENIKGIQYFPSVTNGVLEKDGLYEVLKPMVQAEMSKIYPMANEAWSYLTFLLKTSVCFVEYTDMHGKVLKLCMCSNLNILRACEKFKDGVATFSLANSDTLRKFTAADVNGTVNKEIRGIKVNKKIYTVLKVPFVLKGTRIRIVPICLLNEAMKVAANQTGITRYVYLKDNGDTRTLDTTADRTMLIKHYTSEKADEMLANTSMSLDTLFNRGYIRVVEVGASKYDSGVRALNLSKIKEYKQITDDEVDYRFIDVDFAGIPDTFHHYMECITDVKVLQGYVHDFLPDLNSNNLAYLRQELFTHVDTNILYGSTQYLRTLYLYMLDHPQVFKESVKHVFNIDVGVTSRKETPKETGLEIGELGMDAGVSAEKADWSAMVARKNGVATIQANSAVVTDTVTEDVYSDAGIVDFDSPQPFFTPEMANPIGQDGFIAVSDSEQDDEPPWETFSDNTELTALLAEAGLGSMKSAVEFIDGYAESSVSVDKMSGNTSVVGAVEAENSGTQPPVSESEDFSRFKFSAWDD